MCKRNWTIGIAAIILAVGLGGAALAQNLPKLPDQLTLRQSPGSPGPVTFLHASHMGDRPDCTRCHPKLFSIMKQGAGTTAARRITHADMEKGRQCGACHDGKTAFGRDDCTACHRQ
jgi:c(7)-type cytochrome triheme protein